MKTVSDLSRYIKRRMQTGKTSKERDKLRTTLAQEILDDPDKAFLLLGMSNYTPDEEIIFQKANKMSVLPKKPRKLEALPPLPSIPEETAKVYEFASESEITSLDTPEIEGAIQSFYNEHPELSANVDPNAWIQTYTGLKFYPQNPRPESICIEDIAHALSQQCRFTGHTSVPYSVAQHCLLVSYLCHPENALYGLIHDASEAYITDLSSPVKRLPEMAGYRQLEAKVQQAICRKFGLSEKEPADVKRADLLALSIESHTFMSPPHTDWKMPTNTSFLKIEPLSPPEAKAMFLARFQELSQKSLDI